MTKIMSNDIVNRIKDFVVECYPLDSGKYNYADSIRYRKPDVPEDGSIGYIAYDMDNDKPRMKLTTSRYLTRKCKLCGILTDSEIRELADIIDNMLWGSIVLNGVTIINGPDITQAYQDKIGGHSCMTEGNADYTRLYECNPTRFRMLVIKSKADSARAIIHKLDNGEYLLGVVYATSENLKKTAIEYAKNRNWYYGHKFEENKHKLKMTGLYYEEGEVPYMDTLSSGSIVDGLLNISLFGGDFELTNQDGTLEGGEICCNCEEITNEDRVMHNDDGEAFCECCFSELYSHCQECNNYYSINGSIYIEDSGEYVCQHCASTKFYHCEECDSYHSIDGMVSVEDDMLCISCYENVAGCCGDCGEKFYNSNLSRGKDSWVCSDCAEAIPCSN